jgi:hypothetical protein
MDIIPGTVRIGDATKLRGASLVPDPDLPDLTR